MKILFAAIAIGASALAFGSGPGKTPMHDQAATTYEHLATAIIAIRATEDNLVRGIQTHYAMMAQRHMDAAIANPDSSELKQHVEAAAEEITNVANEGNKPVQAIRQRLLKAGHHHHTDAETQEDYIFVNSREKKELLDLASRIARMGSGTSADQLSGAKDSFVSLFTRVMADE